jgi:peptidyl-dipeptidase Dcp
MATLCAKGFQNNELDNPAKCIKIVNCVFDRAQLLGYATHAHFVLKERMAERVLRK